MAYYLLHGLLVLVWCVEIYLSAYWSLASLGRELHLEVWAGIAAMGLLPALLSFLLAPKKLPAAIIGLFALGNLILGAAMYAESRSDYGRQMQAEIVRAPFDELQNIENTIKPTFAAKPFTFEALQAEQKQVQQITKDAFAKITATVDGPDDPQTKTSKALADLDERINYFHTDANNREQVRTHLRERLAPKFQSYHHRSMARANGGREAIIALAMGTLGMLTVGIWVGTLFLRQRRVGDAVKAAPVETVVNGR